MKKLLFIFTIIHSFNIFASEVKFKEFSQCKKEMKDLREAYAYDIAFGGDYFLNSEFFRNLSRIPDLIYLKNKMFSFRPWLKETTLERKLAACNEAQNKLSPFYGEPRGVNSLSRNNAEEIGLLINNEALVGHSTAIDR